MPSATLFSITLVLFILSTAFGLIIPHSSHIFNFISIPLFALAALNRKRKKVLWLSLIVLSITIGFVRTGWENRIIAKQYIEGRNNISGTITEEPTTNGKYQKFPVIIKNENYTVEIITEQFPKYRLGDKLLVTGKFEKPGELDTAKNMVGGAFLPEIKQTDFKETVIKEHYYKLRAHLNKIKVRMERQLNEILPQPASGLMNGILFGTKNQLSDELISLLTVTGTIHIIALSGFNITIIVEFFRTLTKRSPKNLGILLPSLGILIFVFATGLSASIIRAAIMGWVAMIAKYFGRQSNSIIAIVLTAAIMVYLKPSIILYDIGFQLSFGAILGIVLFTPFISRRLSFLGNTVSELLGTTLGANLITWPILSYHFGRVSLISPLANLFILPLISPLMLLGFLAAIISFGSMWLGRWIALGAWFIIDYILKTIHFFGNLKISEMPLKINGPLLIIGYFLLLIDLYLITEKPFGKK